MRWSTPILPAIIFAASAVPANGNDTGYEDEDEFGPWDVVDTIMTDSIPADIHRIIADTCELSEMTIFGTSEVDAETMYRFVLAHNADFQHEIAEAYIEKGKAYGIRGDIAFCQAIVETGWFSFAGGTAVRAGQHNYCGLGVTRLGLKGHSFSSIEEGVTAQMQHLYAYACTSPLPCGEDVVDPRFGLVKRGSAPTWQALSNRWAANERYGMQIIDIYHRLLQSATPISNDDDATQ